MKIKAKRININVHNDIYPNDDLLFMSTRRLKPSHLLRQKIRELRQIEESGAEELTKQIEKLQTQRNKLFNFLEEKDLKGVYFDWLK